ncbi:reverse transcriptase domain-containing protein [Tanacetum coccineum]
MPNSKGLLSKWTMLEEACTVTMNERCSTVLLNKLPSKEKDPRNFTIPCDIGHLHVNNALADLGASISLMPYTMYENLGLGEPKPIRMSLGTSISGFRDNLRVLPNSNRTRRSREDNIYLSLWNFCLQEDAIWIMKSFNNFSKMHDDKMLARCEETNLVLNWEKCHFMVKEGIVLGHKIFGKGIEVDKAKIDVIAKLPYPTNIQKGVENLAADHLSRLKNLNMGELTKEEITDKFFDEHLMILKAKLNDDEPWYADYVNYIVGKVVPPKWTLERRKWFFSQVRNYFWDKPYAFRLYLDNVMRKCIVGDEILEILAHCHSGSKLSGLTRASVTGRKVYKAGFYWPSIFKDAKDYVIKCDACQKSGNISSRNEVPQNNIQVCEVFDV